MGKKKAKEPETPAKDEVSRVKILNYFLRAGLFSIYKFYSFRF